LSPVRIDPAIPAPQKLRPGLIDLLVEHQEHIRADPIPQKSIALLAAATALISECYIPKWFVISHLNASGQCSDMIRGESPYRAKKKIDSVQISGIFITHECKHRFARVFSTVYALQ
jgi:hypothetical protein